MTIVTQFTPFFWTSTVNDQPRIWQKWEFQHGTGGKFACLSRGGMADIECKKLNGQWDWN